MWINFCVAAALRQERPPRRGARRVGEPTPQQSVNVKLIGKQELCPHGGFSGALYTPGILSYDGTPNPESL